jgi:hypothetical protein
MGPDLLVVVQERDGDTEGVPPFQENRNNRNSRLRRPANRMHRNLHQDGKNLRSMGLVAGAFPGDAAVDSAAEGAGDSGNMRWEQQ